MATQMLQFPLGGGYIRTCFCIGQRDAPDSLAPALAEAVERDITDGSRPEDLATRQEVISMVVRALDEDGKAK